MIFSSSGLRDDLSEAVHQFILDAAVARNNNSLENLEVTNILIGGIGFNCLL